MLICLAVKARNTGGQLGGITEVPEKLGTKVSIHHGGAEKGGTKRKGSKTKETRSAKQKKTVSSHGQPQPSVVPISKKRVQTLNYCRG